MPARADRGWRLAGHGGSRIGVGQDGSLGVSLCSRTSELAQARADLQALGAGIVPVDTTVSLEGGGTAEQAPAGQSSAPLLIGLALALGAAAGGFALWRRRAGSS